MANKPTVKRRDKRPHSKKVSRSAKGPGRPRAKGSGTPGETPAHGDLKCPELYPRQAAFVDDRARYSLCEAGTKSGKTLGCAIWVVRQAWDEQGTIWWWIAPSYAQVMIAFDLIVHGDRMNADANIRRGWKVEALLLIPDQCKVRRTGTFPEIRLWNGSLIQFRTGAEADRLYGAGISGVVIDEASRLSERVFIAVRSTLTMSRGRVKIIGNPRGTRNWFYRLCQRAKSEGGQFSYHHLCSADNPFIPSEEIEDARRVLPERMFRELYLGEAQEGEGQVFERVRQACAVNGVEAPVAGHRYIIGWDPARKQDYSALAIFDSDAPQLREVLLERLTNASYAAQFERVKALSDRYNSAPVIFDATSLGGDLLGEEARRRGLLTIPFNFSHSSKNEIVARMMAALERDGIEFQAEGIQADIARAEMELFEARPLGSTGLVAYGAPEGAHDDTVMARCLALYAFDRKIMFAVEGYLDYLRERAQRTARSTN